MPRYVFSPPPAVTVEVAGDDGLVFPVRRIFCLGRNYQAHINELGGNPAISAPFFFSKPRDALAPNHGALPYPGETQDFQHEVELVVAIGRSGFRVDVAQARKLVFGYAVGVDLTRRDLQFAAMDAARPWDAGKGFDASAVVGSILPAGDKDEPSGAIWLDVNGERRQSSSLGDMIWNIAEILSALSREFELGVGDLVFTGTPHGVSALWPGDIVTAGIDGLPGVGFSVLPAREGYLR